MRGVAACMFVDDGAGLPYFWLRVAGHKHQPVTGLKGSGGLRCWVGVQSNPAWTVPPQQGELARGLEPPVCFDGIARAPPLGLCTV